VPAGGAAFLRTSRTTKGRSPPRRARPRSPPRRAGAPSSRRPPPASTGTGGGLPLQRAVSDSTPRERTRRSSFSRPQNHLDRHRLHLPREARRTFVHSKRERVYPTIRSRMRRAAARSNLCWSRGGGAPIPSVIPFFVISWKSTTLDRRCDRFLVRGSVLRFLSTRKGLRLLRRPFPFSPLARMASAMCQAIASPPVRVARGTRSSPTARNSNSSRTFSAP